MWDPGGRPWDGRNCRWLSLTCGQSNECNGKGARNAPFSTKN